MIGLIRPLAAGQPLHPGLALVHLIVLTALGGGMFWARPPQAQGAHVRLTEE